ncbi:MAG TPA: glycerol-3-phosphate 1-O-acyltransferase PlsY [Candidatus Limnocylindrales bacterium]|nr:glycerol-3-phosphate 1-O-acyltransferase PlsY [Candidatus Limnocylindrales bacterium]
MTATVVLIVLAYLLGSVPSGYLLGKLAGIDVRNVGSGNIGATNVVRAVGKWHGALTLIADVTKGFLPSLIAIQLELDPLAIVFTAVAAFLGHLFPLFLKFRGGKGVATALGALLAIAPVATLVLLALFALVAFSSRIVSLSAMVTAVAAPLVLWLFYQPPAIIGMGFFFAAVILLRHHSNIERLRAGTEPHFGQH